MPTEKEIRQYYRGKCSSYDSKYRCGYYTHIHSGLFPREAFPLLHELGDFRVVINDQYFLGLARRLRLLGAACSGFLSS